MTRRYSFALTRDVDDDGAAIGLPCEEIDRIASSLLEQVRELAGVALDPRRSLKARKHAVGELQRMHHERQHGSDDADRRRAELRRSIVDFYDWTKEGVGLSLRDLIAANAPHLQAKLDSPKGQKLLAAVEANAKTPRGKSKAQTKGEALNALFGHLGLPIGDEHAFRPSKRPKK